MRAAVGLRTTAVLTVSAMLCVAATQAEVIYVDADATGQNNGTSWEDAYTDLQTGLDAANPPDDQLWVANGVYLPSVEVGGAGPRYQSFQLRNGLALYGGFAGGEETLEERNPTLNPTVLSGDIGVPGDHTDNCYHVFYHPQGSNLDETAVLDGFVVAEGNADGNSGDCGRGGAMFNYDASPFIANCRFENNRAAAASNSDGGAMSNRYSSPIIEDCVFSGNTCAHRGGAVANIWNASPVFRSCLFENNVGGLEGSGNGFAGALYNYSLCSPLIVNCTFVGNRANYDGGAVGNEGSALNAYFINCRFTDNSAVLYGGAAYNRSGAEPSYIQCLFNGNEGTAANAHGGAIYNHAAPPIITNCVFFDNQSGCVGDGIYNSQYSDPIITNSILLGEDAIYSGGTSEPVVTYCAIQQSGFENPEWHNISADPLLVDPQQGDFRLSQGSPCIDAGNNEALPSDIADLDGDEDLTEPIPYDYYGNERCHDVPEIPDTGNGTPPIVDIGLHEFGGATAVEERLNPVPLGVYPNPLSPGNRFEFQVPPGARVDLQIFDNGGRLVHTLLTRGQPTVSGRVTWRARDAAGRPMPAGVYHCLLRSGEGVAYRKLTVIR